MNFVICGFPSQRSEVTAVTISGDIIHETDFVGPRTFETGDRTEVVVRLTDSGMRVCYVLGPKGEVLNFSLSGSAKDRLLNCRGEGEWELVEGEPSDSDLYRGSGVLRVTAGARLFFTETDKAGNGIRSWMLKKQI